MPFRRKQIDELIEFVVISPYCNTFDNMNIRQLIKAYLFREFCKHNMIGCSPEEPVSSKYHGKVLNSRYSLQVSKETKSIYSGFQFPGCDTMTVGS